MKSRRPKSGPHYRGIDHSASASAVHTRIPLKSRCTEDSAQSRELGPQRKGDELVSRRGRNRTLLCKSCARGSSWAERLALASGWCPGRLSPRSALTTSPGLASLLSVVLALPRGTPVASAISPAVGPSLSASRIFPRGAAPPARRRSARRARRRVRGARRRTRLDAAARAGCQRAHRLQQRPMGAGHQSPGARLREPDYAMAQRALSTTCLSRSLRTRSGRRG